ncbi:MAG: hypothetical protein C4538_01285 [Nitrospiraceae bacterium]|nr:MAG: hypothetical protein C4538_01285 [Nitrospiraceae bacterium]
MMATRHMNINSYCDSLYAELYNIKTRLVEFVTEIENMEGKDKKILNTFSRHLNEVIETIDWKLEIFTKVCPVEWGKYVKGVESTVSVPSEPSMKESELSAGGYVGG